MFAGENDAGELCWPISGRSAIHFSLPVSCPKRGQQDTRKLAVAPCLDISPSSFSVLKSLSIFWSRIPMQPWISAPDKCIKITMWGTIQIVGKSLSVLIDSWAIWSVLPVSSSETYPFQMSVIRVDDQPHQLRVTDLFSAPSGVAW